MKVDTKTGDADKGVLREFTIKMKKSNGENVLRRSRELTHFR